MKYMGSKNRIAKYIIPIMLKEKRSEQCWVEPFVGGGNIVDKIEGCRLGADINPYLISALVSIRDHLDALPKNNKDFTESQYKELKSSDEYEHKGYAGFALSYGGKWLGGWCRDSELKRDYVQEAYRNSVIQSPRLQGVKLVQSSYVELEIPRNSFIYCDPPYFGATNYKDKFDHGNFWNWCREQAESGHTIYVSEYSAPNDFECVWEKEIVSSLTKDTGSKKAVEKLFKYKK